MLGQVVDAHGQQCDLDLRGTSIASGALIFAHDLRFLRNGNRHVKLSFWITTPPRFDRASARLMKTNILLGEARRGL
jgi:hypothetical protein